MVGRRPLVGRRPALPESRRSRRGHCRVDEFRPEHPATSPTPRRFPHRNRRKSSLCPQKNSPIDRCYRILKLAGLLGLWGVDFWGIIIIIWNEFFVRNFGFELIKCQVVKLCHTALGYSQGVFSLTTEQTNLCVGGSIPPPAHFCLLISFSLNTLPLTLTKINSAPTTDLP